MKVLWIKSILKRINQYIHNTYCAMIFQIQIDNQILSISQKKEAYQFSFQIANLFNHKKFKGLQKFNQEAFRMLAQSFSKCNSQSFTVTYDSPYTISLIYKHKVLQRVFILKQIPQQEINFNEKSWEIQNQSIFDYQNLPQQASLEIKRYPYSSMAQINCKFQIDNKKKMGHAKGFLVSSYLVMTCAHSLYYQNIQAETVHVSFPIISDHMYKAARWFFPKQYRQLSQDQQSVDKCRFDFALIFLEQQANYKPIKIMTNIDQQTILTSIAGNQSKPNKVKRKGNGKGIIVQEKVKVICGNPEFKIEQTKPQYCFNQSYNYATLNMDKDLILHKVSTQRGLSGSQVFIQLTQGQYFAIGIHVAAYKFMEGNLAVRFNERIVKQFQQWQQYLIDSTQEKKLKRKLSKNRIQFVQYTPDKKSMVDKGFSQIDYEEQIYRLKQQADRLNQSGRIQMSLQRSHKLLAHHKIYKNDDIADLVSNQLSSYVQSSLQLVQIKKEEAEKHYKKTGEKVRKQYNYIYEKAQKEMIEGTRILDKSNLKYELQIILREFQRVRIQFHYQKEPYNKYDAFKKIIKKIEEKYKFLDKKYEQVEALKLKNDFLKLKSRVHYYMGLCFEKKRKMAKTFQQFVTARKILNEVQQDDKNDHFKIRSEIIRLCKTQYAKIKYAFLDCYMQGVQNIHFFIDKAHNGNQQALKYFDLSAQFIRFIVGMENQDIVDLLKGVLSNYKASMVMPVKLFAERGLLLLPGKK